MHAMLRFLDETLPLTDPVLAEPDLDLARLATHWATYGARRPMTAEQMRGADRRAQRLGVAGRDLMEQAGTAVGAAARALLNSVDRPSSGLVLFLCGPGNNGGDGFVAARYLAAAGIASYVVLVAARRAPRNAGRGRELGRARRPAQRGANACPGRRTMWRCSSTASSARRWSSTRCWARASAARCASPSARRSSCASRARRLGVPVLAVDTPTALDLSAGEPSDPVVRADVTVTFHRPKVGLATRTGKVLAGKVLVAPIGIPVEADAG